MIELLRHLGVIIQLLGLRFKHETFHFVMKKKVGFYAKEKKREKTRTSTNLIYPIAFCLSRMQYKDEYRFRAPFRSPLY